jgi:hypothetical protein
MTSPLNRPKKNKNAMKKTRSRKKPISAETIARMADNGKDVSRFFFNSGKIIKPIQRVIERPATGRPRRVFY